LNKVKVILTIHTSTLFLDNIFGGHLVQISPNLPLGVVLNYTLIVDVDIVENSLNFVMIKFG